MTLTTDERKEEYYKQVAQKGLAIYSQWKGCRISSKALVSKANEYAFDQRLKMDVDYRIQVLSFAYALGLRIAHRYRTFIQKLFRLFAYLKERDALQLLKRVMAFHNETDILDIIELEMETNAVYILQSIDSQSMGGGKHSAMEEISIQEDMQSLFKGETKGDAQKSAAISDDQTKQGLAKMHDAEREKISVAELKVNKNEATEKKASVQKDKDVQHTKDKFEQKDIDTLKDKKEEKNVEKSVANTSIFVEMMELKQAQREETDSVFPIFRASVDGKVKVNDKEDSVVNEQYEIKFTQDNGEDIGNDARAESNQIKDPFPLFSDENGDSLNDADESTENKARLALKSNMTKVQIGRNTAQLQESTKRIMKQEERARREKNSILESSKAEETEQETDVKSQVTGNIIQSIKK